MVKQLTRRNTIWIFFPTPLKNRFYAIIMLIKITFALLKGSLDDQGKVKGVDREFALLFTTIDETQNWYVEDNIKKYLTDKNPAPFAQLKGKFDFWESNLKAAINGRLFGNAVGFTMYKGEKVVWYLLQIGGFQEMHTVHFHGQSVLYVSITCELESLL